jgi:hypothetical protein
MLNQGGDEGGELFLDKPLNSTSLAAGITIDIFQNKLRFFETGGSVRGVFIDIANSASAGVGTDLLNPSSTPDTVARTTANAAFDKANSANVLAQVAFDAANTSSLAAFNKANSANILAQAAFDKANTAAIEDFTHANAAFNLANTNTITISTVYAHTNSAYDVANTALATAAIAINYDNFANAAFDKANTAGADASGAFAKANSANVLAQAAYDFANTIVSDTQVDPFARTHANAAFDRANSANILAQAAFNTANNANTRTIINGLGNSKLDFNTYGANSAYLTTTNDDSTALFMGAVSVELYTNTNIQIRANTGGTSKQWTFGEDGTLTFPDSTIQNTAYVRANSLIIVAAAPANNKGAGGDTKGMVYLANNYFYYCTSAHDGTTNIWSRIASTDAW